jgi:hypothetical protein
MPPRAGQLGAAGLRFPSQAGQAMRSRIALAFLAALLAACATREVPVAGVARDQIGPSLVVEQFLRAVNANDLATMARLFGTKDGPVQRLDPHRQTEERMFALASLLRHEDYAIEGERVVPGRSAEAMQLLVRMQARERTAIVPFTLVISRDGSWLIEQIGVVALTQGR